MFPIYVPSLKERNSDIPKLVEYLLKLESEELHITQSALSELQNHFFKENIRELRNIIARAVILCETNLIDDSIIGDCISFDTALDQQPTNETVKASSLKQLEAHSLSDLMSKHNGDKSLVAEEAEVSLRTLYRKLEQYELTNNTSK